MGMLDTLLGTGAIDGMAKSLATDIAKRYPPELEKEPGKRPSVNRLTKILEDVCVKAAEFQRNRKLGWYGKAKLGNAFRWELDALGYKKDFVDMATEAVIVQMTKPPTK